MAAALLQAVATTTSFAAVGTSFVGCDSARQLITSPSSVSVTSFNGQFPAVRCGRGDKRTAKGKRFKHSFGNARPKDKSKSRGLGATPLPPRPPKKEYDRGDFIKVEIDKSHFSG